MKFVALISGGKDSIFAILKLLQEGHELVCVANLQPPQKFQELNSYMYQSVGAEIIEFVAKALDKPLISHTINGLPESKSLGYEKTQNDEVENLFELLQMVKEKYPDVKGVSSGAINSTYQKNRVENICKRLDLISLAPLWEIEQVSLLEDMVQNKMDAILIRVCSAGLEEKHLGKSILEIKDYLLYTKDQYGNHCCGEGGEYESFVLDCPIFKKRINILEFENFVENDKPFTFVGRVLFKKVELVDKNN